MLSLRFAGRRWLAWLLLIGPLGALEYLLSEHPGWELLAWATPLLWLVLFHQARPWVAYAVGVLGLTLVYSTQHTVNNLTGAAFHLTNLAFAAAYLLPFLLRQGMASRVPPAARWLLLPLAAVSAEYVLALGPNGTWGSVGYSQGNLYLLQLTAWTGIYGVTFVLYATASLLFAAGQQRRAGQHGGWPVGVALGLLAMCLGGGWLRVRQQAPARAGVRVLGLTFQDARSWPWFRDVVGNRHLTLRLDSALIRQKAAAAHRYYLAQTRQYAQRYRPQWAIWNEAALVVYRPDSAAFATRNAIFAAANGLYLGVTYFLVDQGFPARPGTNHLTIFSPRGLVVYDYMKNKPVSGREPAVGAQQPPTVFRVGAVAYAGAICADFDYPSLIRQAGAADIVFAPAADWPGIGDLHARMAAARALENGFALFRITGQGKSSLTTAYGEEVRSQYHLLPSVQAFVATVPVQKVWTPYRAWGDWFAWLCLGSLFWLAVVGRWRQGGRY
ncbi:hypothetical protein [Hymenobacter sp. PAMC 26628]|uniref:hypothetical protein n=1 Tax=Hymenobacter sp. PAMC 26628 TaxID=1484118 RepID=UPI00077013E5|nr:hypothetical protein [Hymenobacter sp. PAMC 26628]AMJ65383.1 hypothetical protein AXW84_08045 [Hymenobacter sp. PAMC 26628]